MYSILCAIGVVFVILFVPETKGQELDNIAKMFIRRLSRRFSRKHSHSPGNLPSIKDLDGEKSGVINKAMTIDDDDGEKNVKAPKELKGDE